MIQAQIEITEEISQQFLDCCTKHGKTPSTLAVKEAADLFPEGTKRSIVSAYLSAWQNTAIRGGQNVAALKADSEALQAIREYVADFESGAGHPMSETEIIAIVHKICTEGLKDDAPAEKD